eukprot:377552_1
MSFLSRTCINSIKSVKNVKNNNLLHHSYRSSYGIGLPAPPELRDIAKLELFEQETEIKIEQIWLDQYRFDPRYISRAKNRSIMETLLSRFEECPMFIWPINYESTNKYYVLLSQYQHKHIFFTSIDSYNTNSENASAYLSLTFYDDLINSNRSKDIGLIRGEVIQPLHLTIEKARNLCDDVIDKYENDEQFINHIKQFNNNPKGFDLDKYLNTFEFVRNANDAHTNATS